MQEQFGCPHLGISVKPLLHNVAAEKIPNRKQDHALMMSHPCSHQERIMSADSLVCAKVSRFVESIVTQPTQFRHATQVIKRICRSHRKGHRTGIRRYHQPLWHLVPQGQLRHTHRRIAIYAGVVQFTVAASEMPQGICFSAAYVLCARTAPCMLCRSIVSCGERIQIAGIKYSNIVPAHEIRVGGPPRAGTWPVPVATMFPEAHPLCRWQ